ncbi:hypothetical protein Esi_0270_0004 [Ectocarpus siliculosus]|uniref:Uncharacterized protein n=1 Tax=Ectocarpus siliculosus TaxID=2880 RepID=D7FUH8_ECTSI|nr:hypothetical protein Esi_0270_0004 [Ectocarpus siliculosus]|eukprot:CBJ31634.1 hypothetical protein Esi_0270_0004 [Ectocarpus siliculosus]
MDFKVQTFVDQGYTEDEVREALESQNEACPTFSLTECQRQCVRQHHRGRGLLDGRQPGARPVHGGIGMWDYTQRTCCGSNFTSTSTEPSCSLSEEEDDSGDGGNMEGANIGVGLAGGVAVAVGLILTALYFVHRKKKRNRSPKRDRDTTVAEAVGPPENAPRILDAEVRQ